MKIKNLSLICAKAKSHGLKNKNLKKINKKTLFEITCFHVKKSKLIDHTIVSSDSKKILKSAKKFNFSTPFIRPHKLCKRETPEWEVWKHCLNFFKNKYGYLPKALIITSCTSPKRDPIIIDEAIRKFYKTKSDAVLSIVETNVSPYFNLVKINKDNKLKIFIKNKKKIYNRQEVEKTFKITTNIYVLSPEYVLKYNHLFDTNKISYVKVKKENSIDIDDYYDYKIAKSI